MTKSDFHSDFENNRQAIEMDEKAPEEMPSRVEVHKSRKKSPQRKKQDKRKGLTLINIILILFTLIPIGIFVYVLSDLYNPKEGNTVSIDKSGVTFEMDSKEPGGSTGIAAEKEDGDQDQDSSADKNGSAGDDKQAEDNSGDSADPDKSRQQDKAEEQKADQKKPVQPEQKPAPEPEKRPAPKPKPEQKPAPKPEQKPAPKPEAKPDPPAQTKPAGKTHTVGPDETLYRISVNYYGSGEYVEKIKAANGLTSNSISVGQTLILP